MVVKDKKSLTPMLAMSVMYGFSFTFCGFGTPLLGVLVLLMGIPRLWRFRDKPYIVNKDGEPITLVVCLLTWVVTSLLFLGIMLLVLFNQ